MQDTVPKKKYMYMYRKKNSELKFNERNNWWYWTHVLI